MAEFRWVTLQVQDFDASLEFYHEVLGLPIDSIHESEGMKMAMLGKENMPKIEIIHYPGSVVAHEGEGISIGFQVDSLSEYAEYLKSRGIPIARGPVSPAQNISFFFIKDPHGYEVQILERN